MGSDTLRNLHGRLLTFDPQVGYGNLFGRYAIYFSMAYILSCIIVLGDGPNLLFMVSFCCSSS